MEAEHLFLEKVPLAPLEVENQDDATCKEPRTTDSSLLKHTAKRKIKTLSMFEFFSVGVFALVIGTRH